MRNLIITIFLVGCLATTFGRKVDKSEVADTLRRYGVEDYRIPTWQCIIEHESNYDTQAYNSNTGDHGLYQISQIYWCTESGAPGKACNLSCGSLRDDDINDDTRCAMQIFDEWQRIHGNGFLAWVAYKYCH